MLKLHRILLAVILLNTVLFSAVNILKKTLIKQNKMHFTFAKRFDIKNVRHFVLDNPYRHVYDFHNTALRNKHTPLVRSKNVRMAQYKKDIVRVVITANHHKNVAYQPLFLDNEYCIVLPSHSTKKSAKKIKKSKGFSLSFFDDTPTIRMPHSHKSELIVIDAGHGGHDSGAIGGKRREKDLVLQIAKRVERLLKKRGHPVYMTRTSDRFLKLSERTKFADRKKAVAFISIHANSVPKRKRHRIHGIETFFLQNTRDAKSQRIAARENKSVLKGTTKLSQNVIIDSVLTGPKIVQSNKLAIDVQSSIMKNLRTKYTGIVDKGVKHAPFYVLVGASRPSILVEVGYISHAWERKRLFTSKYQELIAKGIADGIDNYLRNRKKEIDFN
jgi:N-acetylmuramoyl-L-alanine amidase